MIKLLSNPQNIAGLFAFAFLVLGFIMLDRGVTGNVILDNNYPLNAVSVVGIIFLLCSAILAAYVIKK